MDTFDDVIEYRERAAELGRSKGEEMRDEIQDVEPERREGD